MVFFERCSMNIVHSHDGYNFISSLFSIRCRRINVTFHFKTLQILVPYYLLASSLWRHYGLNELKKEEHWINLCKFSGNTVADSVIHSKKLAATNFYLSLSSIILIRNNLNINAIYAALLMRPLFSPTQCTIFCQSKYWLTFFFADFLNTENTKWISFWNKICKIFHSLDQNYYMCIYEYVL